MNPIAVYATKIGQTEMVNNPTVNVSHRFKTILELEIAVPSSIIVTANFTVSLYNITGSPQRPPAGGTASVGLALPAAGGNIYSGTTGGTSLLINSQSPQTTAIECVVPFSITHTAVDLPVGKYLAVANFLASGYSPTFIRLEQLSAIVISQEW